MNIPKLETYYPTESDMDKNQLSFYRYFEEKLNKGLFVDVEGNIGYVFVYIYKLLAEWKLKNFPHLHEFLIYLSELYKSEKKLSNYCIYWANDCLLGQNLYEEYLEKTEPKEAFGTSTHASNLRLNIQKKLGLEANPLDILLMAGGRKTKFIINHHALYKEKVREIFNSFANSNKGWFSVFKQWANDKRVYSHQLFSGVPLWESPKLAFKISAFYSAYEHLNHIKKLAKEAENAAREEQGVPKIGEGWVAETTLFRLLESHFSQTQVIQHGQPEWLGKQHFDIWLPNWKIAVEYHGRQHFEPVEFFGGKDAFDKNIERDKRKANLAKRHGVKLFIINEKDDQFELINQITNCINERRITLFK